MTVSAALAAEPLRFVQEPEGSAIPVPAASPTADVASPTPAERRPIAAWRSSSSDRTNRRHLQSGQPADVAIDEIITATDEGASEPTIPPPARVLPSTSKTKVVTIVRPKKSTPTVARLSGAANVASRSSGEPTPAPPRPSASAATPVDMPIAERAPPSQRHLVQAETGGRPQLAGTPTLAAPKPAEPSVGDLVQPMRRNKRHLLRSTASNSNQPALDEAVSVEPSARITRELEPVTETPIAQSSVESAPMPTPARRPAPLIDDEPAASPRQALADAGPASEDSEPATGATFRFRLSAETETAAVEPTSKPTMTRPKPTMTRPTPVMTRPTPAVQAAAPTTRPEPELDDRPAPKMTAALEFRTVDESSDVQQSDAPTGTQHPSVGATQLARSQSSGPVPGRPSTGRRQPTLASRLDALHPAPAPTSTAENAETAPVAQAEIADATHREPPAASQPVDDDDKLAAADNAPTAPAARPSRGAVIDVDRAQQTARLVFG
ncbi:MAG TPA: hypothetical protein VIK18_03420, partial [Pirellulales bacterium]